MRARDLLAFGIRHVGRNGARFSVFGYDDSAVTHFFAVFLAHHVDLAVAAQLERATIRLRVTRHRIIFPVQFPNPDGVRFVPGSVDSINDALVLVAGFFPDHHRVLTRAVAEGRFAFVQFPRAQCWVVRETDRGCRH